MLLFAKLVIYLILGTVAGIISNHLPIPEFSKRNRLFWRIIIWLTLILIAFEIASANDIPTGLKRISILGGFMVTGICLMDGWNLMSAWQDHQQKTTAQQDTDTW